MTENVFPKINGDPVYASEINYQNGQMLTVLAGENITSGNVCYIKKSDGKAYVSDTGTASDIRANGIAMATVTSGNAVTIIISGLYVTSGLTANKTYYLGATGAISQTASGVQVGYSYSTTQLYVNIVQDDRDTIGSVKPYLKSFTGIPSNNLTAFWVECNGQSLSDAESPLNGQTIPNLNGSAGTKRILLGSTTSGTTGGTSAVSTTLSVGSGGNNKGMYAFGSGSLLDDDSSVASNQVRNEMSITPANIIPPYYEVVFIMKVK